MTNFAKNVQEATETELLLWVNTLDPNYTKLASDELTRRTIKRLNESVDKSTLQAKESSDVSERFTAALFLLAVAQLLVAVFQLILSFVYPDNEQARAALGIFMVIATAVILTFFAGKIFKGKRSKAKYEKS